MRGEFKERGGGREARTLSILSNPFEKIQTVLLEVELIINNAPLI